MRNKHILKLFSCFFILCLLLFEDYLITLYLFLILNYKKNNILIKVDISGSKNGNRGPSHFVRGINEILPYITNKCTFIPIKNTFIINKRNSANYFYLPFPKITESFYDNLVNNNKTNKILIGPAFVPIFGNNFPDNNIWKERRFSEILKNVKGIVVHSNRVRDHLVKKSNISQDFMKKFLIARPCTNLKPKIFNSFQNRSNNILFFEKYIDLNRKKQANQLLELFRNSSTKIEKLVYGNYTEKQRFIWPIIQNLSFLFHFMILEL